MNGLEKIIERIKTDSEEECGKITAAAEETAEKIRAEHEARAAEAEAEIEKRTEREAEGIITRAKSSAAMTRRNIISGERSRCVDRAFEEAKKALLGLPKDKYTALVVTLVASAVRSFAETAERRRALYGEVSESVPYEIVLSARDRDEIGEAVLLSIKNNYKKELGVDAVRRITLSDSTAAIDGGVIVRAGAVEENCSISLLVDGLHDKLDGVVYKTLYPGC